MKIDFYIKYPVGGEICCPDVITPKNRWLWKEMPCSSSSDWSQIISVVAKGVNELSYS
jgi:hypothetical protein